MFEGQRKDGGKKDGSGFLPGNELWRRRQRHGRKLSFETPEDLEAACHEYFDWADANPLWEMKAFSNGLTAKLPHPRAMTIRGLCVYIGLGRRSWDDYRTRDGYAEICEIVEDIMFEQKFAGAAAGLFNATIIARDLGLADRQEVDGQLTVEVVDSYEADDS